MTMKGLNLIMEKNPDRLYVPLGIERAINCEDNRTNTDRLM
jgi:hypothetical protein